MPIPSASMMVRRPEVPRRGSPVANIVAIAVLALVVAAIPYAVANWGEISGGLRDRVDAIPELEAERDQAAAVGSESTLVLVTDRDDRLGAIAIAAAVDDGPATLTVVPTQLFELLPGYGDFRLAEALAFEGPDLAAVAVSNAFGVRIDRVAVISGAALSAALPRSVPIELSEDVLEQDEEVQFSIGMAGERSYDSSSVVELLTLQFESNAVAWVDRQAAVWKALLAEMEADPTLASRIFGESPAATALNRVAFNDAAVLFVPVTPVAVAGAEDGFQLEQADVAAFVSERLAHLALGAGERPRAEVLNGNGQILTTRSVVNALVGAGFQIVKTDNAENFDFAETLVVSQGRDNQDAAIRAAAVLGVGMVQLEVSTPSGVVDLSIIVGHDIATLRS